MSHGQGHDPGTLAGPQERSTVLTRAHDE